MNRVSPTTESSMSGLGFAMVNDSEEATALSEQRSLDNEGTMEAEQFKGMIIDARTEDDIPEELPNQLEEMEVASNLQGNPRDEPISSAVESDAEDLYFATGPRKQLWESGKSFPG